MRTPWNILVVIGFTAAACDIQTDTKDSPVDADGDGVNADDDCDDDDASISPNAQEVCDGVDNNCDGEIDNDATDASAFYADSDQDGFGDPGAEVAACEQPSGTVTDATDCDDSSDAIYPGAVEYCDGVDEDCDGNIDNSAVDQLFWYADLDNDGYGDPKVTQLACEAPASYVDNDLDCDDSDASLSPDTVWYPDLDGDGYGEDAPVTSCEEPADHIRDDNTDCNDGSADTFPGAEEVCGDQLVNDCDGTADDALAECLWSGDRATSVAGLELQTSAAYFNAPLGEVGDLNGDGFDDVMVGAMWGASFYGSAHIIYGNTSVASGVSSMDTVPIISGSASLDQMGTDAVGVGDLDSDGYDDVIIGANGHSTAGGMFLYYGPVTSNLTGLDAEASVVGELEYDFVGDQLANVGDLDGDGIDDVLAGAYGYDSYGKAYLLSGALSGTGTAITDAAVATFTGDSSAGYTGAAVGGGDDLNADGVPDLVIGAPSGARAFVFYGPLSGDLSTTSADVTVTGSSYTGKAVMTMPDMDGDGYDDFVVSEPLYGGSQGAVAIFTGNTSSSVSTTSADVRIEGSTAMYFGGYIDTVDDIDGDGIDEILVSSGYDVCARGSISYNNGDMSSYLYHSTGALSGWASATVPSSDADVRFVGTTSYHGSVAVSAGDLDGDGAGDVMTGSRYQYDSTFVFFSESY